jgi:hypothetical protein
LNDVSRRFSSPRPRARARPRARSLFGNAISFDLDEEDDEGITIFQAGDSEEEEVTFLALDEEDEVTSLQSNSADMFELGEDSARVAAVLAPSPVPGRATFEDLLNGQEVSGAWTTSSEASLASFFVGQLLPPPDVSIQGQHPEVWPTLLALYILIEEFPDREPEWTNIAAKAKAFLSAQGVSATSILHLLSLDLA